MARTRVGGKQQCLQGFGGQPEGMALFGTLGCRLKDDIKKDLDGPGWESMDQIHMVHDRSKQRDFLNMLMRFWAS